MATTNRSARRVLTASTAGGSPDYDVVTLTRRYEVVNVVNLGTAELGVTVQGTSLDGSGNNALPTVLGANEVIVVPQGQSVDIPVDTAQYRNTTVVNVGSAASGVRYSVTGR